MKKEELEFKAKVVDGKLVIKPIVVREGNQVIVKVPSLSLINKKGGK